MNAKILIISLLCSLLPHAVLADVWQDPETKVNYEYEPGSGVASVKAGNGYNMPGSPDVEGSITIVSDFVENGNKYTVTSIGKDAFNSCHNISNVVIQNGVTTIEKNAFSNCDNLVSINFPPSMDWVKLQAFSGCERLKEVHITDLAKWCNIDWGGNYDTNPLINAHHLFLNGIEIKDLVIPDGFFKINDCAFQGCSGITSVVIPSSVTTIGYNAFDGCSGLSSVSIPESVTYIDNSAFAYCDNLSSITIPESVTYIGDNAFKDCI